MLNDKELTERQKLCKRLAHARRYHKAAVRWLFDVSRLISMYRDTESWRGDIISDIAEVAKMDSEDALKEIIQTRELIDRIAQELKDYDENERNIRESK
jgi:hypothetical protein